MFTKAVSESLKSLINAAAQHSSVVKAADPCTAPAHHPPTSEAAESKAVADDVMVQITARKSEVGTRQRLASAVPAKKKSETFPSLSSSTRRQANE